MTRLGFHFANVLHDDYIGVSVGVSRRFSILDVDGL